MIKPGRKILSRDEIDRVSSTYLNERGKHDAWEITAVEVEGKSLEAGIRMCSYYNSPTDPDGFHLAMYPPIEFISQLMIIYVHVWAGLYEKTREGWMIECSFSSKRAIRDPENIRVHMNVTSIKKLKEKIYIIAESKVTDRNGGLFDAWMKCLLA